jgi:hypothetical protein
MRDNLLINMSGHDGHSIGVDKNAETNINFQKVCINFFHPRSAHILHKYLGILSFERAACDLGSTCGSWANRSSSSTIENPVYTDSWSTLARYNSYRPICHSAAPQSRIKG